MPRKPEFINSTSGYLTVSEGVPTTVVCVSPRSVPYAVMQLTDTDDIHITDGINLTSWSTPTYSNFTHLRDNYISVILTLKFADDNRVLRCGASHPALSDGFISTDIVVRLNYAPRIVVEQRRTRPLVEGDTLALVCHVDARPSEHITYRWRWRNGWVSGAHSRILRRRLGWRDDGALVECVANNELGAGRGNTSLRLTYEPTFAREIPHVVGRLEGEMLTINCDVTGNPEPEVYWMFGGHVVSEVGLLNISRLKNSQFGVYQCIAVSAKHRPLVHQLHVLKNAPPTVQAQSKSFTAAARDTASLVCLVRSAPEPEITWYKQEEPLMFDTASRLKYDTSSSHEKGTAWSRQILHIRDVTDADYGSYNCTANNTLGLDSVLIQLTKKESIPFHMILGGVGGAVFLIVFLAVILFCMMKGRQRRRSKRKRSAKKRIHRPAAKSTYLTDDWLKKSHDRYGNYYEDYSLLRSHKRARSENKKPNKRQKRRKDRETRRSLSCSQLHEPSHRRRHHHWPQITRPAGRPASGLGSEAPSRPPLPNYYSADPLAEVSHRRRSQYGSENFYDLPRPSSLNFPQLEHRGFTPSNYTDEPLSHWATENKQFESNPYHTQYSNYSINTSPMYVQDASSRQGLTAPSVRRSSFVSSAPPVPELPRLDEIDESLARLPSPRVTSLYSTPV